MARAGESLDFVTVAQILVAVQWPGAWQCVYFGGVSFDAVELPPKWVSEGATCDEGFEWSKRERCVSGGLGRET